MKDKLPIILVFFVFLFGIFPNILMGVLSDFDWINNLYVVGGGINIIDIILLLMFFLFLVEVIKNKNKDGSELNLQIPFIIFCVYMLFEILRNLQQYSLSAPGEFRFRYLILVIVPYLAVSIKKKSQLLTVLKFLIIFGLFIPLILIPYIGFNKGWDFGSTETRFLSSDIHLGMLYGLVFFSVLLKYKYLKNKIALFAVFPFFLFFFLADSHRSVWLVAAVIFIALILLKEIKINKAIIVTIVVLILFAMSLIVFATYGENFINFIGTRAIAFTEPSQDPTANWRLLVWAANFEKFLNNPLFGQGFGGYWYVYVPLLGIVELFPHSLYVMSLVKIGLIGLSLYLIIMTKIYIRMKKFIIERVERNLEHIVVLLSFIYLIAAHFYYTVYSLDYYSMIYIGLGVAVLRNFHTDKIFVNE